MNCVIQRKLETHHPHTFLFYFSLASVTQGIMKVKIFKEGYHEKSKRIL